MAISQNRNMDRSENGELCLGTKLPFQYHRSVELAHYCTCFSDADIQLAILSAVTSTGEVPLKQYLGVSFTSDSLETPRYCFSGNPSIRREHCFGCLDRHMVSVFVVLIFIPATEHASENLSRACWRPFWVVE